MNLAFVFDGYLSGNTTPLLFVFDGWLNTEQKSRSSLEYLVKKEEGGRYYDRKHNDDERRMMEKIISDDNEIFEIIKIWVERCQ